MSKFTKALKFVSVVALTFLAISFVAKDATAAAIFLATATWLAYKNEQSPIQLTIKENE